jgi:RNA polymerase sigma-70 factor (ECF subfamily)
MSDHLVQRWLNNGDERAAEALYRAHRERVYRLAYALLGDASDAETVMQDTMVYALTRAELFKPQRASFTVWLDMITVNQCRGRKRRTPLPNVSLAGGLMDPTSGAGKTTIHRDHGHELWQALEQLDPELREAIVLRYWGGYTYQEMADILRCPLPTAQSRVRQAYEKLRKLLAPTKVPVLGGGSLR